MSLIAAEDAWGGGSPLVAWMRALVGRLLHRPGLFPGLLLLAAAIAAGEGLSGVGVQ